MQKPIKFFTDVSFLAYFLLRKNLNGISFSVLKIFYKIQKMSKNNIVIFHHFRAALKLLKEILKNHQFFHRCSTTCVFNENHLKL